MSSSEFVPALTQLSPKDPPKLNANAILAFVVGRDEEEQLPFFLDYYRKLGVTHFFYVDNDSGDESCAFLLGQPDVTLFHTAQGYLESGCGREWSSHLAAHYGMDHWCLTVDVDELLVFPLCEYMTLRDLTVRLDSQGAEAMLTMMVDMYPKDRTPYTAGVDFRTASPCFDEGPYWVFHNRRFLHINFFGGVRHRMMFPQSPPGTVAERNGAPVLRKVPLVKWKPDTEYIASTHSLKPCQLATVTGALLHFKFLKDFSGYAREELERGERPPGDYEAYAAVDEEKLWSELNGPKTVRYSGSGQLIELGLMGGPETFAKPAVKRIRTLRGDAAAAAAWAAWEAAHRVQASRFQTQAGHLMSQLPLRSL